MNRWHKVSITTVYTYYEFYFCRRLHLSWSSCESSSRSNHEHLNPNENQSHVSIAENAFWRRKRMHYITTINDHCCWWYWIWNGEEGMLQTVQSRMGMMMVRKSDKNNKRRRRKSVGNCQLKNDELKGNYEITSNLINNINITFLRWC